VPHGAFHDLALSYLLCTNTHIAWNRNNIALPALAVRGLHSTAGAQPGVAHEQIGLSQTCDIRETGHVTLHLSVMITRIHVVRSCNRAGQYPALTCLPAWDIRPLTQCLSMGLLPQHIHASMRPPCQYACMQ
jgi:hypothetical protein